MNTARLQRAVAAALQAWHAAGLALVALDDLHHADAVSMELLAPLVSQSHQLGLRWLMAARPEPCAGTRAVRGLDQLAQLTVPPLDTNGLAELLQSLGVPDLQQPGWPNALRQRTGGNPLYVLQLLASLVETGADLSAPAPTPLPQPLLQLVARRLDRLGDTARALVRLAAVAGSDFSLRLATRVMQLPPLALSDPWLELEAAGMMQGEAFAHDLIAEAAAQATPAAIARLLHEQVAQALQDHQGAPARVAHHWDAAGAWAEAANAYEAAARQAAQVGAAQDELQKWQAASRCHRAAGTPAQAFEADCAAARLAISQSMLTDEWLQACQALQHAARSDAQRSQALELQAHFHIEKMEPERGLPLAQQAQALAERGGNTMLQLRAAQRCGYALMRMHRAPEAAANLAPLEAHTHALPLHERLSWQVNLATVLAEANLRQRALQVCAGVCAEAEPAGLWQVAADAWAAQGVALGYLGRLQASFDASAQAVRLSEKAGALEAGLMVDRASMAGSLRDLGRFTEYLQVAEGLIHALYEQGNFFWAHNAEHDLAVAWAWLGQGARAHRLLNLQVPELHPLMRVMRLRTQARLTADFGLSLGGATAHSLAQQAQVALDEAGVPPQDKFRVSIALLLARTGEPASGVRVAEHLMQQSQAQENLMLATSARVVALRLRLALGDAGPAEERAGELMAQLQSHGQPIGLYLPKVYGLCNQALMAADPPGAAQALQAAARWINQCAHQQMPAAFVDSFLHRNPVNRSVLLAANQQGWNAAGVAPQ